MDVYLVGGAVRDSLLGLPVKERDWVVVGSTPEAMLRRGYRQVGRDFPVFLHPDDAEEYALARTERKSGPGHTGFVCHAGPEVTLEEDLRRRDLTVNAMARDQDGTLIDPFGGRDDLARKLLRHVSDAFSEDPLRVYRVARFAAQLPGFQVAPETMALMRTMAASGVLTELAAERVWQEFHKALVTPAPARFLQVLEQAGALAAWFEELQGEPVVLPPTLAGAEQRFAALASPLTPPRVAALGARLKAPRRYQRLAGQVARFTSTLATWRNRSAADVLEALNGIGALDPRHDAGPALRVIQTISGQDLAPLRSLLERLKAVVAEPFLAEGLTGRAVGEAIEAARRDRIAQAQGADSVPAGPVSSDGR